MKINSTGFNKINPYQNQLNKVKESQAATNRTDKVEISSKALHMQEASKFEATRKERLAELKQQVEAGEYKPEPKSVAESLLKFFNQM
ncbi:hypothetical protein Q73_12895 [Bacillus coahuilensis m2-6]|uniref:Negative regulator of flagellin synthesis n=1 Tax=Bacillus coahuilensis p1.1.43 TaxID=1150625 RepID=A0A147K4S8_9BACI|nr:flagellar biosynthesis anti-sigma factor FlgM [Bacillus coahuilensis]KUP04469.1 hypothetical protein Q75_15310 [Bacillus coahuilensis p1.1.43]KUP05711.1 hypothetical protein Q73_12895 [Bacillus coahuilensis m2-6]